MTSTTAERLVVPFAQVGIEAIAEVGGKNASLGALIGQLGGVGCRYLRSCETSCFIALLG